MKRNWKQSTLLASGTLICGLGLGSTLLPAPISVFVTSAQAQEATPEGAEQETETDQLIRALFGQETSPEEYAAAVEKAKASGFSAQLLLESQVVRAIYAQDADALVTLREPLEQAGATLDVENSQLFDVRRDYDSLIQGVLALEAGQKQDAAAFEKHIKEAIWLAPAPFQPLYLSWLNNYREAEAMKNVVFPLDMKLIDSQGKETSFKEVLGTNKALLIDFWASWCAPCMNAMDELKDKGARLAPQGVIVVGLNTESNASIAARVKQQKNISLPWLVEPKGEPFSSLLNVDSIPRMILVSPEGKVLYNGHPSDPALKAALSKVGATL